MRTVCAVLVSLAAAPASAAYIRALPPVDVFVAAPLGGLPGAPAAAPVALPLAPIGIPLIPVPAPRPVQEPGPLPVILPVILPGPEGPGLPPARVDGTGDGPEPFGALVPAPRKPKPLPPAAAAAKLPEPARRAADVPLPEGWLERFFEGRTVDERRPVLVP